MQVYTAEQAAQIKAHLKALESIQYDVEDSRYRIEFEQDEIILWDECQSKKQASLGSFGEALATSITQYGNQVGIDVMEKMVKDLTSTIELTKSSDLSDNEQWRVIMDKIKLDAQGWKMGWDEEGN